MSESETEFNLTSPGPSTVVRAKEPLHSMLLECPTSTIKYTLAQLTDYNHESQLDDKYPEVGLTRRQFIEQVHLAMRIRQLMD